jgi:hypothetical protein
MKTKHGGYTRFVICEKTMLSVSLAEETGEGSICLLSNIKTLHPVL